MGVKRHPIVGISGIDRTDREGREQFCIKVYEADSNGNTLTERWSSEWMDGRYSLVEAIPVVAAMERMRV